MGVDMPSDEVERQVGLGHNSGATDTGTRADPLTEKRARYQAEITRFVLGVRCETSLQPYEIAQLDSMRRLLALRDATLLSSIRWCRQNPRADASVPLLMLINAMTDMRDGACKIGARRMAQVLGRSVENIHRALTRLQKTDCIRAIRVSGGANEWFPVLDRRIVDIEGTSCAWVIDALSTPPARPGRPRAAATIAAGVKNPPDVHVTRFSNEAEIPLTRASKPPDASVRQSLLNKSADEYEEMHVGNAPSILERIERDWFETYHALAANWSGIETWTREQTSDQLRSELIPYEGLGHEVVAVAVPTALAACRAARDKNQAAGNQPRGTMAGYFRRALQSEITRMEQLRRDTAINTAISADIGRIRMEGEALAVATKQRALETAVRDNAARRAAAPSERGNSRSRSLTNGGRFHDGMVIETIGFHRVTGYHCNRVLDAVPGADAALVRTRLLELSKHYTAEKKSSIGELVEALTASVRCAVAYRTHGTPEVLCRSKIATVGTEYMRYMHFGLGEAFCSDMAAKFPAAWQKYQHGRDFFQIFGRAVRAHGPSIEQYGPTTQAAIEADVEDALAEAQVEAESQKLASDARNRRLEGVMEHYSASDIWRFELGLGRTAFEAWGELPLAERRRQLDEWLLSNPSKR
jgi:hypothetical protein